MWIFLTKLFLKILSLESIILIVIWIIKFFHSHICKREQLKRIEKKIDKIKKRIKVKNKAFS